MNNEQIIKMMKLEQKLIDHLAEKGIVDHPEARRMLAEYVKDTPSAKAHIIGTGTAPDPRELADEVWATLGGQKMRALLDEAAKYENENSAGDETELDRINAIKNPRERINAARRAGLA